MKVIVLVNDGTVVPLICKNPEGEKFSVWAFRDERDARTAMVGTSSEYDTSVELKEVTLKED